jgi:hypothetical protein
VKNKINAFKSIKKLNMKVNFNLEILYRISAAWIATSFFACSALSMEKEINDNCIGVNVGSWNNCKAKLTLPNGDEYQGSFISGKKNGRGVLRKKNGDSYIGNWRDDKYHGAGIEFYENNLKQREGFWLDGEYVGTTQKIDQTALAKKELPFGLQSVEMIVTPSNCKLNIYVLPETIPLTKQSSARWNGSCISGNISGKGDLEYSWPDGTTFTYSGEFVGGEPKGYFNGKYSSKYLKGTFKGDARSFGQFFGVHEFEDQYGNLKVYTGESLYITPHGRGVMRNITASILIDGDFKFGKPSGYVLMEYEKNGDKYEGQMIDGKKHGKGIFTKFKEGSKQEGVWQNDKFISHELVDLALLNRDKKFIDTGSINSLKEPERKKSKLNFIKDILVTHTEPSADGEMTIVINANADIASLKINDEEFGGRSDGKYAIKRIARAGQDTLFSIVATDIGGNSASKNITVSRTLIESKIAYLPLRPSLVKRQPDRDAVAIIIGIADYKKLPRADYANDDARIFYDYAIRGLGIKPENIKLLVDADADQAEIIKTFKNWLPPRVKSTTDVYVYYSGHGLPSADGLNLYLLPQQADRDLIEDTAISQSRINTAIQATKPKSVTIFIDSCYSGAGRTGQTLLASARPISLKTNTQIFPSDFTVFTASTADQISSSSNELKHGIFSYYLMKGMEGDADTNKDGKITTGEMQGYLMDNVVRQASLSNRVQQPQLTGDINRVLVGR